VSAPLVRTRIKEVLSGLKSLCGMEKLSADNLRKVRMLLSYVLSVFTKKINCEKSLVQ